MSETLETETVETSLADDIRASFQESTGKAAPETAAPDTPAPEGETETQRDERLRDERGRFARAEQADAPETTDAAQQPEEGAEKPAEAAAPPAAKEPPALWTAADKEAFRKMPPEVQDIWLRRDAEREAHFTRQTQQIAAFRRDFEPVASMFEPHRDIMREKGYTPASLVHGWINTEGGLMNPATAAQTAARIIKGYQIEPGAVMQALGWQPPAAATGMTQDGEPPSQTAAPIQVPPELMALVHGINARVETWEQQQQREREWHQQQATARVVSEIERFKNETGADGRLLRPYFAEVENDMALLADLAVKRGGDTPPLQELYETAVRANPLTYQRLRADETAAEEAQRLAKEKAQRDEARARAARAQRASAPVTGAPRTGHAEQRNGHNASVMDDLRETLRELS